MKVSVDTNAYLAYVDGVTSVVQPIQNASRVAFSAVVLGELRAGFRHGTRTAENEEILRRVLAVSRVEVHDIGEGTASVYAGVWQALRAKGKPIPTNDIWIAAQCIERDFKLLTLDSHFEAVDGLEMAS